MKMNILYNIIPYPIHVRKMYFFKHDYRTCYHFSIFLTRFKNVGEFWHFADTLLKRGRFLAVYGQGVNNLNPKTDFAALFATQPLIQQTICENLKGIRYEF